MLPLIMQIGITHPVFILYVNTEPNKSKHMWTKFALLLHTDRYKSEHSILYHYIKETCLIV